MGRYLTQAWLDECREIWASMPERPGATARIQYVLEGDEPVRYRDVHQRVAAMTEFPD